jgi:hypothetical protein
MHNPIFVPNISVEAICSKDVHFWDLEKIDLRGSIPSKFQNPIILHLWDQIFPQLSKELADKHKVFLKRRGFRPETNIYEKSRENCVKGKYSSNSLKKLS